MHEAIDSSQAQIKALAHSNEKLNKTLDSSKKVYEGEVDTFQTSTKALEDAKVQSATDSLLSNVLTHLETIKSQGLEFIKSEAAGRVIEGAQSLLKLKGLNNNLHEKLAELTKELSFIGAIKKVELEFILAEQTTTEWNTLLQEPQKWEEKIAQGKTLLQTFNELETVLPLEEQLTTPEVKDLLKSTLYKLDQAKTHVQKNLDPILLYVDPEQYRIMVEQSLDEQLYFRIPDDNQRQLEKQRILPEIWAVLDGSDGIQPEEVTQKVQELIERLLADIPYIIKIKGNHGKVYDCIYKPAPKPREAGRLQKEAEQLIETYENLLRTNEIAISNRDSEKEITILNGAITYKRENPKSAAYEIITVTPYEVSIFSSTDPDKDPKRAQAMAFQEAFEAWRTSGSDSTILTFGDPPQNFDLKPFLENPPIPKEKLSLLYITSKLEKIKEMGQEQTPQYVRSQTADFAAFIDGMSYNIPEEGYTNTSNGLFPYPYDERSIYIYEKKGNKLINTIVYTESATIVEHTSVKVTMYLNEKGQQIKNIRQDVIFDRDNPQILYNRVTVKEYFGSAKDGNEIEERKVYLDGVLTSATRLDIYGKVIADVGTDEESALTIKGPHGETITLGSYSYERKRHPGLSVDEYLRMVAKILPDDKALNEYINQMIEYVYDLDLYKKSEYFATPQEFFSHERGGRSQGDCEDYVFGALKKILEYRGIKAYPISITTYEDYDHGNDRHVATLKKDRGRVITTPTGRHILIDKHAELMALFKDKNGKYYIKSYGTSGVNINGESVQKDVPKVAFNTKEEAFAAAHKTWDKTGLGHQTIDHVPDEQGKPRKVMIFKDPVIYPEVNLAERYEDKLLIIDFSSLVSNSEK